MPSPLTQYQQKIQSGQFQHDAAQHAALKALEPTFQQLQTTPNFWQTLLKSQPKLPSYYLVGDVGRGKTWIMNALYRSIKHSQKQRWHFYAFMQQIQIQLQQQQGQTNPLSRIAKQLRQQCRLLCLDEFFIQHIQEAIIIRQLFEVLLHDNMTLIITSNIAPEALYQEGLQRQQFLPTIALIQANMQILNLGEGRDFRLITQANSHYYSPLDANAATALQQAFSDCQGQVKTAQTLWLNQHPLPIIAQHQDCVWLSFEALCKAAHSPWDYLSLAQQIQHLILEQVPQLRSSEDDQARRFISLIDILYDQDIQLYLSAAVDIEQLYIGETLQADFKRIRSRLVAMTRF